MNQEARLTTLHFYSSAYNNIADADAAASAAGGVLEIDTNVSLLGATTLETKEIIFGGGVISLAGHTLTILGAISSGGTTIFDLSAGGTVVLTTGQVVNALWFGADPTNSIDSSTAINAALATNQTVYLPKGKYQFSSTIRFQTNSQVFFGDGCGDAYATVGQTQLSYTGTAGGVGISFATKPISFGGYVVQNSLLRDLDVEGNNLLNVGVQLYDDAETGAGGGAWRNKLINVAISKVTNGANAVGVYLGAGATPAFAQDSLLSSCLIYNCTIGISGVGSFYSLGPKVTIFQCGTGIKAGQGSAWDVFGGSVFSGNGWDFSGTNIQHATLRGCWFENSSSGIYQANTAHNVDISGCYLHTQATLLMNFGAAAGYHSLAGNFVPSGSSSTIVGGVNPTSAYGAVVGQPISLLDANGNAFPFIKQTTGGFTISEGQNGQTVVAVENTNTGGSADAAFHASNGNTFTNFGMRGTAEAAYGSLMANMGYIYNPSTAGFMICADTGPVYVSAGGNVAKVMLAPGSTNGWSTLSDEREKTLVAPIERALEKISTLRTTMGRYREEDTEVQKAFLLAQDVQKVLPCAVCTDEKGMLWLNTTDVIPLIVAAIKELSAAIGHSTAVVAKD